MSSRAPPELLLSLRDVSYRYPDAAPGEIALSPVSLDVSTGEVVRISGRNGTGKSTLLKVVCGILLPTTGSRIVSQSAAPVYLDQDAGAFTASALTVREQLLVGLGSRVRIFGDGRRNAALQESVEDMSSYGIDLEHKLDSFVGALSGGQRQVVALLSVLARGSRLVLLDEFTGAMDSRSVESSVSLIRAAVSQHAIGVLFVDHRVDALPIDREVSIER